MGGDAFATQTRRIRSGRRPCVDALLATIDAIVRDRCTAGDANPNFTATESKPMPSSVRLGRSCVPAQPGRNVASARRLTARLCCPGAPAAAQGARSAAAAQDIAQPDACNCTPRHPRGLPCPAVRCTFPAPIPLSFPPPAPRRFAPSTALTPASVSARTVIPCRLASRKHVCRRGMRNLTPVAHGGCAGDSIQKSKFRYSEPSWASSYIGLPGPVTRDPQARTRAARV